MSIAPLPLVRGTAWQPSALTDRWAPDGDLRQLGVRILVAELWAAAFTLAVIATWAYTLGPSHLGVDAHAYWLGGRQAEPYGIAPGQTDAVLYSPAFVMLMRPLALLSWPLFLGAWMVAAALAFWWLSAPLHWTWRVPVLAVCWPAVLLGNVTPLLCVCSVLALTRGGSWTAVPSALTKITPAFMPVVWWMADHQWRRAFEAATLTLLVIAVTYVLDPQLWGQWVSFLLEQSANSPWRILRLLLAAALAVWAAATRRPWAAGLAFYFLLPVVGWLSGLMVLPRLLRPSSPLRGS
jgi:hypothetical protein